MTARMRNSGRWNWRGWGQVLGVGGPSPVNLQRRGAKLPEGQLSLPPVVRVVGDLCHRDFRELFALLQNTSQVGFDSAPIAELVLVAQSRPGLISDTRIAALRGESPLAGVVAILGAWCEGEPRTGRPWPGVRRLYWYEFSAWWRRQLAVRGAGRCPEWSQPAIGELRIADCGAPIAGEKSQGLVAMNTLSRATSMAIADPLRRVGYTAIDLPRSQRTAPRGCVAGIWEGGQLDHVEQVGLERFSQALAGDSAPVVALLDFPRRDLVDKSLSLGAAAVLGKPWLNADLLNTLVSVRGSSNRRDAA